MCQLTLFDLLYLAALGTVYLSSDGYCYNFRHQIAFYTGPQNCDGNQGEVSDAGSTTSDTLEKSSHV